MKLCDRHFAVLASQKGTLEGTLRKRGERSMDGASRFGGAHGRVPSALVCVVSKHFILLEIQRNGEGSLVKLLSIEGQRPAWMYCVGASVCWNVGKGR